MDGLWSVPKTRFAEAFFEGSVLQKALRKCLEGRNILSQSTTFAEYDPLLHLPQCEKETRDRGNFPNKRL